jgi:hypothetical protein
MILIQINESHVFDTCIILFHGTFEKSCFFIKPINLLLLFEDCKRFQHTCTHY